MFLRVKLYLSIYLTNDLTIYLSVYLSIRMCIYICYPPKDLPKSMPSETFLATFIPTVQIMMTQTGGGHVKTCAYPGSLRCFRRVSEAMKQMNAATMLSY